MNWLLVDLARLPRTLGRALPRQIRDRRRRCDRCGARAGRRGRVAGADRAVYELMCHQGRLVQAEVADPRLLRYHDWERELAALTDPAVKASLAKRGVRVVGYRVVEVSESRLVPGPR